MGFSKKLHTRDEISGLHVHQDIQPGSYGAEELAKRNQSRLEDLNAKIKADWPENMTATDASADHETYGNAGSRLPRPSDVSSKGGERYGTTVTPGEQSAKRAPRSDSKESK